MFKRIFILQDDLRRGQPLVDYFTRHGSRTWLADNPGQAAVIIQEVHPDLALIDLHMKNDGWLEVLNFLHAQAPGCKIILTNHHPDVRAELMAQERGMRIFLREPFTTDWIEKALKRLESKPGEAAGTTHSVSPGRRKSPALPPVRLPMRIKITVPYALLAMVFALLAVFMASRYVLESLRDRFTSQLIDAGKITADWIVQEESQRLESLRLLANTDGVADAILNRDAGALLDLAMPVAVNYQEEDIDILDLNGVSLLSLHHTPGGGLEEYSVFNGDNTLGQNDFVRRVLSNQEDSRGDKYAGLAQVPWGDIFYIAGPVYGADGVLQGVVLVGKSVTTLAKQIRQDTLAHVTFYNLDGVSLASTLMVQPDQNPLAIENAAQILSSQDQESDIRELKVGSMAYSEILGPWEVRGGEDIGILGITLAQNYLARPTLVTRLQIAVFVMVIFLGIIALGIYVAHQITSPLSRVVQASVEVAQGNLEVKVPSGGNDEVMVLAHAFNYMVSGLQEGFIYRDLLGRTVSPEVREAMRTSFASGDLRLEGQNAMGTVLMSDIRSFTTLAEKEEPTTVLNWLNEYFSVMVPIITEHGGVVDKFEGDAILAFFGILPKPLPAEESANQACQAAVALLDAVEKLNIRRTARGEPRLITGIGVNTGMLTAGGLGTADRLNYTIIGDTVNTTQRMQEITREFGESGAVVSEYTLTSLSPQRSLFSITPLGERSFKGKREQVWVYRLSSAGDVRQSMIEMAVA